LRIITENIRSNLLNTIKPRGEVCERLMRELSHKKKERVERARQREMEEQAAAAAERKKNLTVTPKKRGREDETRPPAVGAHGVARQDGGDSHTGK
jgi:transcriptional adapter 3